MWANIIGSLSNGASRRALCLQGREVHILQAGLHRLEAGSGRAVGLPVRERPPTAQPGRDEVVA